MSIIVCISICSFVIVATLVMSGVLTKNEDVIASGIILLILVVLSHIFFQLGADWQHSDTLENYNLVKKAKESK